LLFKLTFYQIFIYNQNYNSNTYFEALVSLLRSFRTEKNKTFNGIEDRN